jgi:hypothetical protein
VAANLDVIVEVVKFDTPTSTGTLDITTTRLRGKTPKVARVVYSRHSPTADPASTTQAIMSIGATDGTRTFVATSTDETGLTNNTDVYRDQISGSVLRALGVTSGETLINADFSAFITNGIRLNFTTVEATTFRGYVVLYAGDDYQGRVDTKALGTGTAALSVTGVGFSADAVEFFSAGAATASGVEGFFDLGYGIAVNDGVPTQKSMVLTDTDASAAGATPGSYISTNKCFTQVNVGAATVQYQLTFGNVVADGFDLTPSASAGSDDVFFIAHKFGGCRVKLFELNTPTATGNVAYTDPGWKPQAVLIGGTSSAARDTARWDAGTERFRLGIFCPQDYWCSGVFIDNTNPTATSSVTQQHGIAIGATLGDLVSFDLTGLTVNYTAVAATAFPVFALAIEEGGGALDKTLGAVTLAGTGTVDIDGTLAKTLGAVTLAGAGSVDIDGALAKTLGAVTSTGTATADIDGALDKTLGAITLSSAGSVDIDGSLAKTLGAITLVAAGDAIVPPDEGVFDKALGAVTLSGTGTVDFAPAPEPSSGREVYLVIIYPRLRSATDLTFSAAVPLGILPYGIPPVGSSPPGGVVEFYYADGRYTSPPGGVNNTNTYFDGRAEQPLRLNRLLPVAPESERRVAIEVAAIQLFNTDGEFDGLIRQYAIDGRKIEVYVGNQDDDFDDFTLVFTGAGVNWTTDLVRCQIAARDVSHKLDVPLQTSTYSGAGGVNGTSENKGKRRPMVFGECKGVPLTPINPTLLIYQVHSRTVQSIDSVYERAAALTFDADYASYALLAGAVVAAGKYASCKAEGLIRFQTTPLGVVTADVKGDAVGSYVNKTDTIIDRMLQEFAGVDAGDIDSTALAAIGTAVTGTIGVYFGTDAISGKDAISQVMAGCSGWWGGTPAGLYTFGRIAAPDNTAVALTLDTADVVDAELIDAPPGTSVPRFTQRVAYNRNWTVQREDIAAAVTATRRQQVAEPFSLSTAVSLLTQVDFLLAADPEPLMSLFLNSADADTEATRLLDLFSVPRTTVRAVMKSSVSTTAYDALLGDTISLTHPRVNDGNTFYARLIGLEVDAKSREVALILWG